jgi:glutaredoxin
MAPSLRPLAALALAALPVGALAVALAPAPARAEVRGLARCLSNAGVVFYGTWWCPYCRKQREAFGAEAANLPYVECSDAGSRRTRSACREAGVRSYPTWVLPNGIVLRGVQSPDVLASLSGCG